MHRRHATTSKPPPPQEPSSLMKNDDALKKYKHSTMTIRTKIMAAFSLMGLLALLLMLIRFHKDDHTTTTTTTHHQASLSWLRTSSSSTHAALRQPRQPPLQTNHVDKDDDDMDHVIRIFQEANVTLTPDDIKALPSWNQITALHGSQPLVYGNLGDNNNNNDDNNNNNNNNPTYHDTCQRYQQLVPPLERMIGCAGMFNTGTNVITKLLKANCIIPERYEHYGPGQSKETYGMRFQVPWGKHTPAHYKWDHATKQAQAINKTNILPVVTIRHPYDWMTSMCHHNYEARWNHNDQGQCPHLADLDPMTHQPQLVPVNVNIRERVVHKSLAHLWNDWYHEYYDPPAQESPYPFLMVRFEDIIFHTKQTTQQICECAGGILRPNEPFQYIVESAKDGPGHGKVSERTGMVKAWMKYGTPPSPQHGFNNLDYHMAQQHLSSQLMNEFQYSHPPP
eukprot:CAMPEP_0195287108 /NCGR_PEP_ID=MMETSP0707-20130614/4312_1 /TAXON_ID=33640 /ORGANISM="Asterionellopsis glacialis, Strain CCMP134" /LENGTH=450 /DNA_ID=CAMNT_0040346835 /DNA_START=234 /DNA_END=1582 /DNA_ORIENTATION=+